VAHKPNAKVGFDVDSRTIVSSLVGPGSKAGFGMCSGPLAGPVAGPMSKVGDVRFVGPSELLLVDGQSFLVLTIKFSVL
jgi:hypothetical protein